MNYTRGNDIVSALKYFYQNKYGIDTVVLSECRSIPEVICVAEKLQIPQNEGVILGNDSVEIINALGKFYEDKKTQSKVNKFSNKKAKPARNPEPIVKSEDPTPIVEVEDKPVEVAHD